MDPYCRHAELDQLEDLINAFVDHLVTERRLSLLTGKAYRQDLKRLLAFCRENNICSWDKLDAMHVRSFLGLQRRLGQSSHTIRRLLSAMRGFYQFLIREEYIVHDPIVGITAFPRKSRRLPKVLDVDQMAGLLNSHEDTPLAIRDWAIMELLYSSGLRLTELVALNLSNLDLNEGLIRVIGKGNKTRIVPVGRMARQAITQWLRIRSRFVGIEKSALFLSRRKTRLTARSIQARLQKSGIARNMDISLHPHLFRHSCASHLLESSGDLRAVQEILGHADVNTTQIYTHLDFQYLANVYDRTHPRAKNKSIDNNSEPKSLR
uniref:Tyrosine recombinase XerC n=1 Tax=Candidatus Kentrum sp. TUN TaxID=2126343 RepID=A0A450ZKS6_9GAMM|nr:MAG: integrase/recombinase XerC [Candidatus Kentron sp. TUN]VFK54396.1 MAG: integrase/recombinase XerC [Candidatus Kentron sp. TUN]VFK55480.1 MAG: integrase/recombinase XerC [Candidatus Kentron sp. TUN]